MIDRNKSEIVNNKCYLCKKNLVFDIINNKPIKSCVYYYCYKNKDREIKKLYNCSVS